MKISVIIPVHQGESFLPALLELIARQTVTCSEVWVVETEPTEAARAHAERFGAHYESVAAADYDHGGTRTAIARRSTGEVLVFLTQDVRPVNEDAIERLVASFETDSSIAASYGRQVPDDTAHPFSMIKRNFNYPETAMTKGLEDCDRLGLRTVFISNAFAAYRRSALDEVGWFPDRQLMCEDITAAARLVSAGHLIRYQADAVVLHTHDLSMRTELRRYFDIGVAHRQQEWIRQNFGRPSREGLRYLKLGVGELVAGGHTALLPAFVLHCVFGNLAYSLGRHHRLLPTRWRARCSSFPLWWNKSGGAGPCEVRSPIQVGLSDNGRDHIANEPTP